jgi:Kef-type K+ transport system membrane component KefB/nucleotide-binding universal stress UspA family protein
MRLDELIPILLVQIALVLGLSRLLGWLCSRWHQPQVIGEMAAGIMLGPSLLGLISAYAQHRGWLSFDFSHRLFPPESISYLGILSQIGVIFFLFLVGLDLDPKLLRSRGHAAVVISHVSIVAPFILGAALTLYLYPRLFNDSPQMSFTAVALFMGAAMSITAFPVLARILTERNLTKTKVGAVAITCAAVDDVTAWCMLAFVVAVARAKGLHAAFVTAVLSAAYVLVMFFVVRPFVGRLRLMFERQGRLSQTVFAAVVLLILASAWTTEKIGIHALFGAFLMGAIMPKDHRFVHGLSEKLEDVTVVFLLPIFFAYTGLKTQIGLLNSPELWGMTLLVILVACAGKFGGSALAARACGLGWRDGAAIGILMNTRGLMELVILNVGRDLGVITPAVFAMMVLMALVTTFMTTPLLQLVMPKRLYQAALAAGARVKTRGFSVLIPVAHPKSGGPLLQLAATLVDPGAERAIFALHLRRPADREAYHPLLADERKPETEEVLRPLLAHAERHRIPVEAISFTAADVAEGVAEVATERQASLVLIGFHHSVFSRTMLGGTVHRILESVETDVAVFVDRGYLGARKILVPYRGGEHDRLALQIAARAARGAEAQVEVLHVTTTGARGASKPAAARSEAERVFAPRNAENPVTWAFRSVDDPSPVDAVLREAGGYDLVVIGVSEEWGLESHLFGLRPERIAEQSPTSMLIVRKFGEARELPSESDTTASAPPPPATEVGGPAVSSSVS